MLDMGRHNKPFELTVKQVEQRDAAASGARHILAYGGSRSGKTFGFTRCVAARALSAPGSRHLICRLHNIDIRQAVLMDTWPSMMAAAFPDVPYGVNKSDQYVTLNDSEIWFGGLDDKERVEKILGKEYSTIYSNETSQIPYETILTLRTRLAQMAYKSNGNRLPLKAYYDLNPIGRSHWTHSEFILGVRPDNPLIKIDTATRAFVQMNPIDNPHLPPEYLEELMALPERQKQRFFDGKYLSEVPGTLWPLERIDAGRVDNHPELARIVIAVDPSGTDGAGGDSIGIIAAGKGIDGAGYVLEDATCRLSPAGWGRRVAEIHDRWGADCIVAEANYGGAMVQSTIQIAAPQAKVKMVNASRGKHIRAEPIAALYEGGDGREIKAHHVGLFPELEDQMAAFTTSSYQGSGSPDRADALVWALTELMLNETATAAMFLKARHRK